MKPTLKELKKYLETDSKNLLEVFAGDGERLLEKELSLEKANTDHGGFYKYFENLYKRGVTTVYIGKKRRYGSSTSKRTATYLIELATNGEQSQATPQTHLPSNAPQGLAGMIGGLSGEAMLDNYAKAQRYPEMHAELERYKTQVYDLEKTNRDLEKKVLEYQLGVAGRPSAGEELVKTLSNPEVITGIAQMVAAAKGAPTTPTPATGLGQATTTGSELKDSFVQLLQQDRVNDQQANLAFLVLDKVMTGDQQFTDAVVQLIEPQNAPTNG